MLESGKYCSMLNTPLMFAIFCPNTYLSCLSYFILNTHLSWLQYFGHTHLSCLQYKLSTNVGENLLSCCRKEENITTRLWNKANICILHIPLLSPLYFVKEYAPTSHVHNELSQTKYPPVCEQHTLCDAENDSLGHFLWPFYFTRHFWQVLENLISKSCETVCNVKITENLA